MALFNKSPTENVKLKVLAVLTFVVMVVCNALANILPINGISTGAISDSYPNLFAPIGFTFAIWGIIYTLLALFCVFQFSRLRGRKSKASEVMLNRILPYFIASSVINSVWIFAWHYKQIGLSTVLIILILVCLIKIVSILKETNLRAKDYLFVRLPFSVYFGWITVAVIANITTWLVSIDWNGWGLQDVLWTMVVLVTGVVIGLIVSEKNRDPAYLLVLVWAYFGILAKHVGESGFNGRYEDVIVVLVLSLGVFVYRFYTLASVTITKNKSINHK